MELWKSLGASEELISVNEVTYDKDFLFNAELTRDERGLYGIFHYDSQISCREAMTKDDCVIYKGLTAVAYLKQSLGLDAYLDIQEIFDLYPDAIIEMTAFNELAGKWLKRYVIWEVRTDY